MTTDIGAIKTAYARANRHGLAEEACYSHEAVGSLLAQRDALLAAIAQEVRERFRRTIMNGRDIADYLHEAHGIDVFADEVGIS